MTETKNMPQTTPPKRKRGRPRKMEPAEKPKKRGRPKKTETPEKPKKRGRPRKTPDAGLTPVAEKAMAVEKAAYDAKHELPNEGRIPVGQVVVLPENFPRFKRHLDKVQEYRQALDKLPPILINQNRLLIDGWHRLQAHIEEGKTDIAYEVRLVKDTNVIREAVFTNNTTDMGLTLREKAHWARIAYQEWGMDEIALEARFSVSNRTIRNWLQAIKQDSKEQRDAKIQGLAEKGKTQSEIAEETGIPQTTVSYALKKEGEGLKSQKETGEFFSKNGKLAKIAKVEHIDRSLRKPMSLMDRVEAQAAAHASADLPALQVSVPADGPLTVPMYTRIRTLILQGDINPDIARTLDVHVKAVIRIRTSLESRVRQLHREGCTPDEINHREHYPRKFISEVLNRLQQPPSQDDTHPAPVPIPRPKKPEGFEEVRQQFTAIEASVNAGYFAHAQRDFLAHKFKDSAKNLVEYQQQITTVISDIQDIEKAQPKEADPRDTAASA